MQAHSLSACSTPTGLSRTTLPRLRFLRVTSCGTCLVFRHKRTVLYRASQLRKRFAKLRGRATDDSPKRAIEVRHGLKSACESSFANSRVRIEQKRLWFLDSDSREIVDEIYAGRFLEHLAKVMPADVSRLGHASERQRLRLMFLDEVPCSRHVHGLVVFTPYG